MKSYFLALIVLAATLSVSAKNYDLSQYGIQANTTINSAPLLVNAIREIVAGHQSDTPIVLRFTKGKYHFYPTAALEREYYISNHDQTNPKSTGIPLEGLKNLELDGQGAEFIFHGRMLPLSLIDCENCTLKNFSVDFENPHITQFKIIANDTIARKITFEVAPWVKYKLDNGTFVAYGKDWQHTPEACIAFDENTRHIVFNTSDLRANFRQVSESAPRTIVAENWKQTKLLPGTVIAGRTWHRPAPGIFIHHSENTRIENVQVHYAEGMGLLAQLCTDITLDRFSVCLKGEKDPRYFTTQADATHFSGCKGIIISKNGLYEGMMDDAINVHGTYLKIKQRLDDHTVIARYMHPQAYGFEWGVNGDEVQFVRSATMELTGGKNRVKEILPNDKDTVKGAKEYRITFAEPLDAEITDKEGFGIENLSWCPEVYFADNVIRNNRARGTLFSTPLKTVVERNLFDHTSGTAILLCGDCNGWFETGACRNVLIRNNRFINALTNMFQFTEAVISIYPEIPDLEHQKKYFHGGKGEKGVVIEDNYFETFDRPVLFAKSIDGLIFKNNVIRQNTDYPAFHHNKSRFRLLHTRNVKIEKNNFEDGDESIARE